MLGPTSVVSATPNTDEVIVCINTADDPACPLTSVGCVFNDQNVWANVQVFEKLKDIEHRNFGSSAGCWPPLFTLRFP